MSVRMKYCLDTNVFIEPWVRLYPEDLFPSFWRKLSEFAHTELAIAPTQVLEEIERRNDDLHEWVREHGDLFVSIDEAMDKSMKHLMAHYPKLVNMGLQPVGADPFVIALAHSRPPAAVVSLEAPGTRKNRPKIPSVCRELDVEYIDILELMRRLEWRF